MSLRKPVSEEDHIQGDPNAPIELVEYGDYQCPHCGRAYPVVKELQQQLGSRLKLIFRNFPLSKIHPQARAAAIAAEAAAFQGKYWEMHDILFENQTRINPTALIEYAQKIDLDLARFKEDILNPALIEKVEAEFYNGMRSGVNATPTFFINGEKYEHMVDKDLMLTYINENYPG